MNRPYPPAPWQTHGEGVIASFLVPADAIRLPPAQVPFRVGPLTFGLLAYIDYQPPSPLAYQELIWMPCLLQGRHGRPAGYYVAKMYVDNEASLQAGREIWALPKQRASFHRRGARVEVKAEDGASLVLSRRSAGPAFPFKNRVATLQVRGGQQVRFQADFRAWASLGLLRVHELSASDSGWESLRRAKALPLAVYLRGFTSLMREPVVLSGKPPARS